MKIKIVKCSDKSLWYAHRVGEVFDVIESSVNKDFWVVKNIRLMPCLRHAVRKTECRPITLGKRQTQAANKRSLKRAKPRIKRVR